MADPDGPEAGEVIDGRYRIVRPLASGAMGVVYLGKHVALERLVAVKVLRRELAVREDLVARFEQEARAASAIGHPNIVDIFDLGRCRDGRPYMAMELLDGVTLADRLAVEGPLPWSQVIELGAQLLAGLEAAHNHGIVHRDLKPENLVLVERADRPALLKILDFGISKISHPGLRHFAARTEHGYVLGTMGYMSPEQARGQTELVDHRTDLYAAGVVLYELLAGRPPFEGENYNAVLSAILEHRYDAIATLLPEAPPGLGEVIDRALAIDRAARFGTALEMRDALLASGAAPGPAARASSALPESLEVVGLDGWGEGGREPRAAPALVHAPTAIAGPAAAAAAAADDEDLRFRPPPRGPTPLALLVQPLAAAIVPRPGVLAPSRLDAPEPAPAFRRSRLGPLVLLAVVAAAAGAWLVGRRVLEPPDPGMALRVLPAEATIWVDGAAQTDRTLHVLPGTSHILSAAAPGYVAVERPFIVRTGGALELRLPHALPLVEEEDLAALPVATPGPGGARPPAWDRLDRDVRSVEEHRACLARGRRAGCTALLDSSERPPGGAAGPLDAATGAYLRALAMREDGRPADVAKAAAALRAELWLERGRIDADELALLAPEQQNDDWRARKLLVDARAGLRPGAEASRLVAAEALEAFRRESDPRVANAADEAIAALRQRRNKAREPYNRLVELYNGRPLRVEAPRAEGPAR